MRRVRLRHKDFSTHREDRIVIVDSGKMKIVQQHERWKVPEWRYYSSNIMVTDTNWQTYVSSNSKLVSAIFERFIYILRILQLLEKMELNNHE